MMDSGTTTKLFKRLNGVNDAQEIFKMKKNLFEVCLAMLLMRRPDKRKYG